MQTCRHSTWDEEEEEYQQFKDIFSHIGNERPVWAANAPVSKSKRERDSHYWFIRVMTTDFMFAWQ